MRFSKWIVKLFSLFISKDSARFWSLSCINSDGAISAQWAYVFLGTIMETVVLFRFSQSNLKSWLSWSVELFSLYSGAGKERNFILTAD